MNSPHGRRSGSGRLLDPLPSKVSAVAAAQSAHAPMQPAPAAAPGSGRLTTAQTGAQNASAASKKSGGALH